ncbi:venom serine protease inhibitor [Microplitis demolitor]|uniref:venom serine protease inhibitor n=1 Tax=Microplitis demolitor TaxID=69319 RepID=UPI0004CDC727|nr:venom serine protease inhibitor [Microplitis demolitor]
MFKYALVLVLVLFTFTSVQGFGCSNNEHGSICGSYKEPECYRHFYTPSAIECIQRLRPGCRCDKGYVRNPHSKQCVQKIECLAATARGLGWSAQNWIDQILI